MLGTAILLTLMSCFKRALLVKERSIPLIGMVFLTWRHEVRWLSYDLRLVSTAGQTCMVGTSYCNTLE